MPYMNGFAVQEFLESHPDAARVSNAYALRCLVHTATFPPGYSADSRWVQAIQPTQAGRELLTRVASQSLPAPDLHLALFGLFWFHDPLIDFVSTDLEVVREIIEEEALAKRFYWPIAQGRSLYDHCYTLGFSETDNLTAEEAVSLLDNSPLGVYHVGHLVTGPLGITDSHCVRVFAPLQYLGLWHCPMLDCGELHGVQFVPPRIPLLEAYQLLDKMAVELWKTASRWQGPLSTWPHSPENRWRAWSEVPLFLGDTIVDEDRTKLLSKMLATDHGKPIRKILALKRRKIASGHPDTIAAQLSDLEQLQLLLTPPDIVIKESLDELIWSQEIRVPTAEVREVEPSKRELCGIPYRSALELSCLGIRATRHSPILLLQHLVSTAYAQAGEMSDLDWRLQTPPGANTQDVLMDFLRNSTPPVAIEKLILSSPRITKTVTQHLEARIDNPGERARTILEWKLGFNIPRGDSRLANIKTVINYFKATVSRIGVPRSDGDRQTVRSSGVNAFVEFEGFLDELVSYLVWVLASDHPRVTRFLYARNIAVARVPTVLGSAVGSGGEVMEWKTTGNTLGTCLRYLQELVKWIESLPHADREPLERTEVETNPPLSDNVRTLPFRHVELWADANPASLIELASLLSQALLILKQVDVPGVRNGLEHYREPHRFPATDRTFSTAEAMLEFVKFADEKRLFPKLYWLNGTTVDPFGQRSIELVDYNNNRLQIHTPRTITGTPAPRGLSPCRPVLVAPGNIIGLPNSDLLFEVRPDSVYSKYWESYPARGEDTILPRLDDNPSEAAYEALPGSARE